MHKNLLGQSLPVKLPGTKKAVFEVNEASDNGLLSDWMYWLLIIVLLFTLHWRMDVVVEWFSRLTDYLFGILGFNVPEYMLAGLKRRTLREITAWRGFLYYFSLIPICYIAFRPICLFMSSKEERMNIKKALSLGLLGYVFLFILIIPIRPTYPFLYESMGYFYSYVTYSPFDMEAIPFYKRLLVPSLAYILQIKGFILFFFLYTALIIFYLSSFFFVIIKLLNDFTEDSKVILGSKIVSLVVFSFLTSSCFISNFQMYGYLDFIYIWLVMLMLVCPQNERSFLGIFVISLCSHELSLFVFFPLALCCYPRSWGMKMLLVSFVYCSFWLLSFGFDVSSFRASSYVLGKTTLEWLTGDPSVIYRGTFFAFKLWWILWAVVVFVLLKKKLWSVSLLILISAFFPYITFYLAVDSSRMAGNAFLSFFLVTIIALSWLQNNKRWGVLFGLFSVINIIIPSVFVGANIGYRTFYGLYSYADAFFYTWYP